MKTLEEIKEEIIELIDNVSLYGDPHQGEVIQECIEVVRSYKG